MTLLFGVSAAGAGYGITYLANHGSAYVSPTSKYMFFGTLAFALAVLWCLAATFTRLTDFRLTAKKLRRELEGADTIELGKLLERTRFMGKCTWALLYLQLVFLGAGVVLFALTFWGNL